MNNLYLLTLLAWDGYKIIPFQCVIMVLFDLDKEMAKLENDKEIADFNKDLFKKLGKDIKGFVPNRSADEIRDIRLVYWKKLER